MNAHPDDDRQDTPPTAAPIAATGARLRQWLEVEAERVRETADHADPEGPVPTCPDWTVADLLHHLGAVYLHKVACMRSGRPTIWPPDGLIDEDPLVLFDRGLRDLIGELAARTPQSHSYTWCAANQSVAFWIRRMAHETVIHRVDIELAAGLPATAIPADIARDGIDELLMVFLAYGSRAWPDQYADVLAEAGNPVTVGVQTAKASWRVEITAHGVNVSPAATADRAAGVDAEVRGEPGTLLMWLWNRVADDEVTMTGEPEAVALFRRCLLVGTE